MSQDDAPMIDQFFDIPQYDVLVTGTSTECNEFYRDSIVYL